MPRGATRQPGYTPGKFKAGRIQSHSQRLWIAGSALWTLTKCLNCRICWYGDLDDTTWGWGVRSWGSAQGRLSSVLLQSCPAGHTQSPGLASPFLKGLPARAGTLSSPRSHGLGAQHRRLQWLERLKLQSTAPMGDPGTAPAPRVGADGVTTTRKRQEHS